MSFGVAPFGLGTYGATILASAPISTIESEAQKLAPSSIVDFFELNATNIGGGVYYFHAGVNNFGNDVVWQGTTYSKYPIEVEGFEKTSSGSLPRPTIRAANIYGAISGLVYTYSDLIGAKLIRRRTFVKYLDAVNFASGINTSADPDTHFPDEVWIVDRKSGENPIYVEFELAAAFDLAGVFLPRRQCIQNSCSWTYKSAECGYTGSIMATYNDIITTNPSEDKCGKRLSSCSIRFGESAELPFGGFPGTGLSR